MRSGGGGVFDWVLVPGVFVAVPIIVVLLVARVALARRRLMAAAGAPTWASLTNGELIVDHQGEVVSFWASGRPDRSSSRATSASTFVVFDQVALVSVELQPWPWRPKVRWYERREDLPLLRVMPSWLGPAIVEDAEGMDLVWRGEPLEAVVSRLAAAGWNVWCDASR
jgi:hypothetical protein